MWEKAKEKKRSKGRAFVFGLLIFLCGVVLGLQVRRILSGSGFLEPRMSNAITSQGAFVFAPVIQAMPFVHSGNR